MRRGEGEKHSCRCSAPLTLRPARLACAELGLPEAAIETDPRLKEIAYGDWEGLTYDQIEASDPGNWAARQRDPWGFVVPGGESYEMVAARAGAFLSETNGHTIVISHGGTGRVLRGLYARLAPPEIKTLERPQDALHRLTQGTIARIGHDESGSKRSAGRSRTFDIFLLRLGS